MPRPLPPPPSFTLPEARKPLLSVEINVVTLLFGGGAMPATPDPLLPVRGSSVRGQLRFWWRACKASGFANAMELYEAESSIWGASADEEGKFGPSAINVEVEILDVGRRLSLGEWTNQCPSYVTFPFRPPQSKFPVDAIEGIRVRLTLGLAAHAKELERPELAQQAEAALWAWISFGGIGARTRRGCGSLFCGDTRFLPQSPLSKWVKEMASRHILPGDGNPLVAALTGARLAYDGQPHAMLRAWSKTATAWQEFRQGRRGEPRRWPDAASVRQALGMTAAGSAPADPYYPRADLGLPIIFQRIDPTRSKFQAEMVAHGEGTGRMASPIILKPLAISEEMALPIALLLHAPHVWERDTPDVGFRQRRIEQSQLFDLAKSEKVEPLAGHATARDAFIASAARQWQLSEVRL